MSTNWRPWAVVALLVLTGGFSSHAQQAAEASPRDHAVAGSPPHRQQTGTASFYVTTISIPTYPYAPCLEPASSGPYSYHRLNWTCYESSQPVAVPRDYALLVMENEYLRVTVLPELGGRIFQLISRTTGSNQLYQNPVIMPTHYGPVEQGWWLAAGGIEWGLPVEEHGYEWGEPWSWSVATTTAGVTVTVQDTLDPNLLRATVDLFLPAYRAYVAVTPRLENPTAVSISYKFWINAMLAPGPHNQPSAGLEFVFNADEMSVHSTGDSRLPGHFPVEPTGPDYRFGWPLFDGTDFSRLASWHEWLGFFEYPRAAADFIGVYDHDAGEGVARVFPSDVARGAKGFAFGWANPTDWHQWTDDGSSYVELHGGVAPTFWDTAVLAAGASLSWTEFWYPIGPVGGLTAATQEAALSAREHLGRIVIGVQPTVRHAAWQSSVALWDRASCTRLAQRPLPEISPARPFLTSVTAAGHTLQQVTVGYLDGDGNLLAAVNPAPCLSLRALVAPLPPVVTTAFPVNWAGRESSADIAAYDVQVREGTEGTWSDWLIDTGATSAAFSGSHGHTYFFRARGRNAAGDQGVYDGAEWGQAYATVLTSPAPVLVTSRIQVAGSGPAPFPDWTRLGQTISTTVLVSNTGSLTATATVTVPVPAGMAILTPTLSASEGPPPTYSAGAVRWSSGVGAGHTVRLSYVLSPTVTVQVGDRVRQTAHIEGSVLGPVERSAITTYFDTVWLPLLAH